MNIDPTNPPDGVEARLTQLEAKIDRLLPFLEGLSSEQKQLAAAQKEFVGTQGMFAASQEGFAASQERFAASQEGFAAKQERLAATQEGFAATQEGFAAVQIEFGVELTRFRGFVLGKLDGLQGTVELVREDIRNAWSTADFAITNSRHAREDTDKIMALLSTMQRQHQTLTSQVDELRKREAERRNGM